MNEITAIIVDDEEKARKNLGALLQEYCPEVNVLEDCANIQAARIALLNHRPSLVFLDINMPGGSGFDLISELNNRDFEVIFTTAYNEFAIQAFEHHAVGYLLKPIVAKNLIASVQRAGQMARANDVGFDRLLSDLKRGPGGKKRLALPTEGGFEMIPSDQIMRFQARGSYTIVFLVNGEQRLLVKNLKALSPILSGQEFFRIHHSHLINLDHVEKVIKTDGGFVRMTDGTELEISRRKRGELLDYLSS